MPKTGSFDPMNIVLCKDQLLADSVAEARGLIAGWRIVGVVKTDGQVSAVYRLQSVTGIAHGYSSARTW